jgi:hypothetical protein
MGLTLDFLTRSPATLGSPAVAFSTHDLTSAAAQPHDGANSTRAVQMSIFIPSPPILTLYPGIEPQRTRQGNLLKER